MANCFEIERTLGKLKKAWYLDGRIADRLNITGACEKHQVPLYPNKEPRNVHVFDGYLWREWIYCGSDEAVDAAATQSLLRSHAAIWCPPPGLRHWSATPEAGDTMWLVWRGNATTV